jgi:peptidoglycan/LPS O-acetylase OafA/YrhL
MTGLPNLLREDDSHLHVLTGIRGWAALWVFLYHAWIFADHPPLTWTVAGHTLVFTPLVSLGGAGVSIFFVLSGFLLALPFAEWQGGLRPRPDTGRYLFRRVARVFPAYYVQLVLLMGLAWYFPGLPGIGDWSAFGRHLLMLFTPPPLGTTPMNPVWWTLPIEFSFYLALPFLAILLRYERWWWLPLTMLLSMWAWRHAVVIWLADAPIPARVVASYQLPGSLDTFGLGMLAALLYVQRARLPAWVFRPAANNGLAVAGLLLIVMAVYWLFGSRNLYWADNLIFYGWTPALALGTAAIIFSEIGRAHV